MSNISDFATKRGCTVWPYVGRDVYGNPNFGAPIYMPLSIWYEATNEKFIDSKGAELISKYEVYVKFQYQVNFKEGYYISLNADNSSEPNPIIANAHEIKSVSVIFVPFGGGLEDEMVVMV